MADVCLNEARSDHHPGFSRSCEEATMGDTLFLIGVGMAVILAEHVYALTGWPPPGLVNK